MEVYSICCLAFSKRTALIGLRRAVMFKSTIPTAFYTRHLVDRRTPNFGLQRHPHDLVDPKIRMSVGPSDIQSHELP